MVNVNKQIGKNGPSAAPAAWSDPQYGPRSYLRLAPFRYRNGSTVLTGPRVIAACLIGVAFVTACTTYREAKPSVAAEPPKVYQPKTHDDMRQQEAVPSESGDDAEAKKKKQAAGSNAQ